MIKGDYVIPEYPALISSMVVHAKTNWTVKTVDNPFKIIDFFDNHSKVIDEAWQGKWCVMVDVNGCDWKVPIAMLRSYDLVNNLNTI